MGGGKILRQENYKMAENNSKNTSLNGKIPAFYTKTLGLQSRLLTFIGVGIGITDDTLPHSVLARQCYHGYDRIVTLR